jgi:hypothetical protein
MNRPELYEKSVNILLDAYNAGELSHGNCERCAVGNLLADTLAQASLPRSHWGWFFQTVYLPDQQEFRQRIMPLDHSEILEEIIESYGYTMKELSEIEYAFETCDIEWNKRHTLGTVVFGQVLRKYVDATEKEKKEHQFTGLVAVLDKLREIHEIDQPIHEENITRLEKVRDLVCV